MITYISFESALHIITVIYVFPILVLVMASTIGLAVIEAVEEVGEL